MFKDWLVCLLQEWQDGHFLERADSGAIAAVHDAALVHVLVSHCCELTIDTFARPLPTLTDNLKHSMHSPFNLCMIGTVVGCDLVIEAI